MALRTRDNHGCAGLYYGNSPDEPEIALCAHSCSLCASKNGVLSGREQVSEQKARHKDGQRTQSKGSNSQYSSPSQQLEAAVVVSARQRDLFKKHHHLKAGSLLNTCELLQADSEPI